MTIRVRILALLGALALMAASEGLLVLYLQQLSQQTRELVDRRASVRDRQSRLEVSLLELKSAARDAIRSGAPVDARHPAALAYAAHLEQLGAVTRDEQQRARLEAIARDVGQWRATWPQPESVGIEQAISLLETGFVPVRADLDAFGARQELLYAEAQEESRRTEARYTGFMLALPAIAIVLMGVAIAAVRRQVLNPLASLAAEAEGITRGEYPQLTGSTRRDEIGALINAFTGMIDTVRNREAELSRALAKSRELTKRSRTAEEKAVRSRAELETVIETVPAALILVHKSEGVRRQNRAASRLIGEPDAADAGTVAPRYTLAGRDGVDLPPASWPLARALAGETVPGEDLIVRMRDGRELSVLVSAAPMVDEHGQEPWGAVAVFQDLAALKAIDRLKDEFVSIVSHELRTPLTSIRGSLQLVLADAGSVPDEDNRQLVQVALNNCERLIRIINDILDIAKIEAGKTGIAARPCDVRELVRTAIENVDGVARQASVAFALHVPGDLPAVQADPDRIVQVLVNLLSNAVKFAPEGSLVSVDAKRVDAMIEISISDRGKGISEEDLPRLFQKFQQLDGSATRAKGGTGLGLAIVRGLVEQHGGRVDVGAAADGGARFSFTLPIATAPVAERRPEVDRRNVAARVLVVDDDDDFRGITRRHLERAGFAVVEARSGEEALQAARHQKPDVITLDLLMPGMNGWTLIRNLAADPALADVPTIVLSSVADRAGNLARDVAVVSKSSGIDVLLAEVMALLPVSGTGCVLVAEDDDDLRSLLAGALRKRGFTTREVRDGAEALAMMDESVSLLVLDLNMPGVGGLDVLRQVRERGGAKQIPVLIITGTEGMQESAMKLGASGYIKKPLDVAEVTRVVQRLIKRGQDPSETE